MNFEQARFNMIEQQIRPWDVLDQDVLTLLSVVRREDFVPAAWVECAFVDTEIPLVEGGPHEQNGRVMLQPKVEARVLQELRVGPGRGRSTRWRSTLRWPPPPPTTCAARA